MFIPDTPIYHFEEDQLGRARFAKNLAEVICRWEPDDSIVVGLYGPWGSGKTSLVNMTIEHIDALDYQDKQQKPIIVKFNPWYFSNTEELMLAFFVQLFTEISTKSEKFKIFLKNRFKNYGKALKKAEKAPAVGKAMGLIGDVLEFAIQDQNLIGHRKELDNEFKGLKRKIIIVIDDIDRLRQSEIRQMLQVVKLNADFPNTVYLLAGDRPIIENALVTEQGISGRNYLEKIVQIGFDIPPIDQAYISKLLTEEISRVVGINSFDINRWAEIYQAGFRNFFVNLRDVKRFINGLAFNFSFVSEEINVEDFIGLEALRTFTPKVYEGIAQNKALFTSFRFSAAQEELKTQFDSIFALDQNHQEICKEVTLSLFPQTRSVYGGTFYTTQYLPSWRKAKRICVSENFDTYFLLGVPVGEVSQTELDRLKIAARDREQLNTILQDIFDTGRFRRLLEKISNILGDLDAVAVKNLCEVLLELGESLPIEPTFFISLETDQLLAFTIYQLVWRMEEDERCQWLKAQIVNGDALYTPIRQVAVAATDLQKKSKDIIFNESCIQELKEISVKKIKQIAEIGRLLDKKHASFLLLKWQDWSSDQTDLQKFLDHILETPEQTSLLVRAFLQYATFNYDVHKQINIADLRQLVDPRRVLAQLSKLTTEQLQEMPEDTGLAINSLEEILQKE